MHDQGIGPDHVHDPSGLVDPEAARQLRCADVGQDRRIRCPVSQRGVQPPARTALQRTPLRPYGQGDAEGLGRLGQMGIDGLGPRRATRHGADQERCPQPPPQKVHAQVDLRVVEIRQGVMDETDGIEASVPRMAPAPRQHDVQVLVLAVADRVFGHVFLLSDARSRLEPRATRRRVRP